MVVSTHSARFLRIQLVTESINYQSITLFHEKRYIDCTRFLSECTLPKVVQSSVVPTTFLYPVKRGCVIQNPFARMGDSCASPTALIVQFLHSALSTVDFSTSILEKQNLVSLFFWVVTTCAVASGASTWFANGNNQNVLAALAMWCAFPFKFNSLTCFMDKSQFQRL